MNFANFYIVSTDLDHSQGGYSIRVNIHDSLGVFAPDLSGMEEGLTRAQAADLLCGMLEVLDRRESGWF